MTGKPFIFAVGADLSGVPSVTDAAQAREIAETGHRVFRRLKDSSIPTFAFVNGAALGGGLELALHCHYRTIATTAVVAFPEVFLGLVPGWGGTQLLPNLIGIDPAVTVIVENALAQNKITPGPKAAKLGIADVVFEPADFLERSLEWAVGVVGGEVAVSRPEVDRSAWDDAIARATGDRRRPHPRRLPRRAARGASCSTWPGPGSTATRSPRAPRPRTTP